MKSASDFFPFSDYADGKINHEDILSRMEAYAKEYAASQQLSPNLVKDWILSYWGFDKEQEIESLSDDLQNRYYDMVAAFKAGREQLSPNPVLRWVGASERLPEKHGFYYIRNDKGLKDVSFWGGENPWWKDNVEWLDESASPSLGSEKKEEDLDTSSSIS